MNDTLRLALIYGSVREGRFCDIVARWAASEVTRRAEFALDPIDPADGWPAIDAALFRSRLDAADAVILVTPEYNHSYPGPLKMLIDSAGREWQAKPVAFVSYGGVSGGLRAVEHLRGVVAELHAVALRDTVSFPNAWELFGRNGRPIDEFGPSQAMRTMLDQLAWWARTLKAGREASTYGRAA